MDIDDKRIAELFEKYGFLVDKWFSSCTIKYPTISMGNMETEIPMDSFLVSLIGGRKKISGPVDIKDMQGRAAYREYMGYERDYISMCSEVVSLLIRNGEQISGKEARKWLILNNLVFRVFDDDHRILGKPNPFIDADDYVYTFHEKENIPQAAGEERKKFIEGKQKWIDRAISSQQKKYEEWALPEKSIRRYADDIEKNLDFICEVLSGGYFGACPSSDSESWDVQEYFSDVSDTSKKIAKKYGYKTDFTLKIPNDKLEMNKRYGDEFYASCELDLSTKTGSREKLLSISDGMILFGREKVKRCREKGLREKEIMRFQTDVLRMSDDFYRKAERKDCIAYA